MTVVFVLLGLIFGSFVNVVALRVPHGKSIVSPGSACAHCGEPVRGRDNIPVLSWIILRGRCRDCKQPFSIRYPIVEAATGLMFALFYLHFGLVWVLPAYLVFIVVTMALVLTDIDLKRIPNAILFPGGAISAVLLAGGALLDGQGQDLLRGLAGGAAYFGFFFLLALITRGGFGMGDVKLAALLGLFTTYQSWTTLTTGAFMAFMIGGLVAVFLLVTKRKGRKDEVPFGPYLIFGAWLATLSGPDLVTWLRG